MFKFYVIQIPADDLLHYEYRSTVDARRRVYGVQPKEADDLGYDNQRGGVSPGGHVYGCSTREDAIDLATNLATKKAGVQWVVVEASQCVRSVAAPPTVANFTDAGLLPA